MPAIVRARVLALTVALAAGGALSCAPAPPEPPGPFGSPPVEISRPTGATVGLAQWYRATAHDGHWLTLGLIRTADPDAPTVVMLPSSLGLDRYSEWFSAGLASKGVNVVVACWFRGGPSMNPIECANGPNQTWTSAAAVVVVDDIVAAVHKLPAISDNVAIVGWSRGGGVSILRSLMGRSEPAISISGLLTGAHGCVCARPGDVDLRTHADGYHGDVLLIGARNDVITAVADNVDPLVDSMTDAHPELDAPKLAIRDDGSHDELVMGKQWNWTATKIVAFVNAQFD